MNRRGMTIAGALNVAVSLATGLAALPALAQSEPKSNAFWWPERIDLSQLRDHDPPRTRTARTSTTPRPSPVSTSTRSRPTCARS